MHFVHLSCVRCLIKNVAVKLQTFNWSSHVIEPNGQLQHFRVPSPISVS